MENTEYNCGKCKAFIPPHFRIVRCTACQKFYHVRCCKIDYNTYRSIKSGGWICEICTANHILPGNNENIEGNERIHEQIYENMPEYDVPRAREQTIRPVSIMAVNNNPGSLENRETTDSDEILNERQRNILDALNEQTFSQTTRTLHRGAEIPLHFFFNKQLDSA